MTEDDTNSAPNPKTGIVPVTIESEMSSSYLDYAMSVIVSRAIPDVRDGLKPVHRRILFSMNQMGLDHNKPYRKSARVVGDVIGKYHPHGDSAVYESLVRMAQSFSMRAPLVDGQGNFGSIDGDRPAAMRYTECRLDKITTLMLEDIDKDCIAYQENYDGSESEPSVLPSKFPNLLINGAGGIAVGMATNIPPHNLTEVIDGCVAILKNPNTTEEELNAIIPGPDFPTGGMIIGRTGIRSAQQTGRGSVIVRGKAEIETQNNRNSIIITEIPYQVNKSNLIEKIADLVREKKIEGIADIRDVSDRHGIRVIVELKKDAESDVILNQLYKFTPLQSSFGCNMVTLNSGKPELLSLRQIIDAFLEFRVEIVVKRTTYLLNKSRDRAHVLVGLAIAIANIDEIISVIRSSPDPATARDYMLKKKWIPKNVDSLIKLIDDPRHKIAEDGSYMLSIEQVQAILDLRLQRLTAIGRDEIEKELNSIGQDIKKYLEILSNRQVLDNIIEEELNNSKDSFGNPRRTEIMDIELDVDDEDLIPKQDVVITVSHKGYIKRVPLSTYRSQRRGGKGRAGMSTRDEDFVTQIFVENTHTPILFFSSTGIVYKMKGYKLPQGTPQSKGKAMINLLPLGEGENITTIMPLPENEEEWENLLLMFTTENGNVRKNKLSDFVDVRSNGKIAMKLQGDDKIKSVETCTDNDDILITTSKGQCIRFRVKDVRLFVGRSSTGVRGIKLAKDNRVISATIINALNATTEERLAYIKMSKAVRGDLEQEVEINEDSIEDADPTVLSDEKYAEMGASEQFILSISNNGFGKRTSTYEYRVTGRGGKGIIAMVVNERNGDLSDSFPVDPSNQIILVTDKGKLIRCPVDDIRIASRSTQGVKIFDIDNEEQVVSVERLGDIEADDDSEADHIEDLDDE
ncbi:MAG: DNA gyrase subunit A [Alphaproteobacteria bacterium]|uniref:DNA gyrase subunit A n=1 Tax=PS1 clade bacterium TaxID=2175152 RepID=A0A368DNC9_9PROT|nr:DNA gyrase subunit A [Rhodobiaceae bacterium]OUT75594.1 MAG: DNA gyrase subunit A [Rhizobiales bacterium TMED25]RCL72836.1 MAG: DNA gyrase subunit A [PS1 clade bacterium]